MYILNVQQLYDVNAMIFCYISCTTLKSIIFHLVSDLSTGSNMFRTHLQPARHRLDALPCVENWNNVKMPGSCLFQFIKCWWFWSVDPLCGPTAQKYITWSTIGTRESHSLCPPRPIHRPGMCLTLCTPCIFLTSNYISNVLLLQYQECCVGTCTTVYFGIPGAETYRILYVVYDFLVVLCVFVGYCNYL